MQAIALTLWCGCGGEKSQLYRGLVGGLVPNGAADVAHGPAQCPSL